MSFQTKATEDSHFSRLFNEVLDFFRMKVNVVDDDIVRAITEFIESFKKSPPGKGGNFLTVDMNNVPFLFAYLYRYGPLGAGLTRQRIIDGINECSKFRQHLKDLEKQKVNVLSLGGGPGNDIVGFCSALDGHVQYRNMNIVIVDVIKRFASCLNILEFLAREGDFGNVTKFFRENNVTTSFIYTDLQSISEEDVEYFEAIKSADILIVAKLLSIVPEDDQLYLIDTITQGMKNGAMLLCIDAPLENDYFVGLEVIYWSEAPNYMFSGTDFTPRFGHDLAKSSKAQLVVAQKIAGGPKRKSSCELGNTPSRSRLEGESNGEQSLS